MEPGLATKLWAGRVDLDLGTGRGRRNNNNKINMLTRDEHQVAPAIVVNLRNVSSSSDQLNNNINITKQLRRAVRKICLLLDLDLTCPLEPFPCQISPNGL